MRGLREARLREAAEKAGFEKQFREAASFEKRPARPSPSGGTGRWNGLSQRQEIEGEFDLVPGDGEGGEQDDSDVDFDAESTDAVDSGVSDSESNNKAEVRAPLSMFPYHYSLIHHSLYI